MNRRAHYIFVLAALLVIAAGGCTSLPYPDEISRTQLSFLQPGLSEVELLVRFGAPTGRFEGERILTWRLGLLKGEIEPATRVFVLEVPDEDTGPENWKGTLFDLVVVLDDHHLLKQFALVPVRQG